MSGERYYFTDLISNGFNGDLGGVVESENLGRGAFLIGSYNLGVNGEAEQIIGASWVDSSFNDRSFGVASASSVPESNFLLGVLCGFFLLTLRLRGLTRKLVK